MTVTLTLTLTVTLTLTLTLILTLSLSLILILTLTLTRARWAKLVKDFYKPKKDTFDTTKVPDLYDNALYDMVHNRHLELGSLPEVYAEARTLASYVVPQVSSGK